MDNSFNFALHILAALLMTLAYKYVHSKSGRSDMFPVCCFFFLHMYVTTFVIAFVAKLVDSEGLAFKIIEVIVEDVFCLRPVAIRII